MIVFHSKQNGFYPDLKEPLYNVYMCVSFCLPLHRWHATKYFVSNMNSWRMVELISVTEPNRKEQLFHMHALPRCVCVYAINSNEESGHKINIRRSNWRNKKKFTHWTRRSCERDAYEAWICSKRMLAATIQYYWWLYLSSTSIVGFNKFFESSSHKHIHCKILHF